MTFEVLILSVFEDQRMAPPPSLFRNIAMSLLDAMPYLLWIYNSEAPEVRGFDKMKKYRPEI